MADKLNREGEIEEAKGKRGLSAAGAERDYYKYLNTKPKRASQREAPYGPDSLHLRAAGVDGSILERIVYKMLDKVWGKRNFIYKYQVGSAPGVKDARAFIGGIEMDFVILNRPSGKELDLEVQGAHWHGPSDQYADLERALILLGTGRDYAEIWEWEVLMGDEFLENRLLEIIGASGRVDRGQDLDEIEAYRRELGTFRQT